MKKAFAPNLGAAGRKAKSKVRPYHRVLGAVRVLSVCLATQTLSAWTEPSQPTHAGVRHDGARARVAFKRTLALGRRDRRALS